MSPLASLVLAAALLSLVVGEGVELRRLARESLFLLWLGGFAILAQGFDLRGALQVNEEGMAAALAYFAHLIAAFMAGRLFYASTTRSELREAATEAARLVPGAGKKRIGLGLSLILGFVPLIVDEWRSTLEAAEARAAPLVLSPRQGSLKRNAALLEAYLRRLMLAAVQMPEVLEARGWSGDRTRRAQAWKVDDYASTLALAFLLALSALRVV
jgi:energy-coupling factor transporter transmembrane protein EcfT